MSEYDAATYERFSGAVRRQVQSLRIILDSLQVNSSPEGCVQCFQQSLSVLSFPSFLKHTHTTHIAAITAASLFLPAFALKS